MATKSKSGLIRKAVGPRRTRLIQYIAAGDELTAQAAGLGDDRDNIDEKAKLIMDIEALIGKLDAIINSLEDNHKQWQDHMETLNNDDVGAEEAVYDDFMQPNNLITNLDDGKERVSDLRLSLRRLQRPVAPTVARDGDVVAPAASVSRYRMTKLPKISLPQFDGDPLRWAEFWAIFKGNVDDAAELHGVEKLAYLKGQLRGAALAAIDGLVINNDSYAVAVDILRERFEHKTERVISTLYSQLKRLPTSSSRVSELQKTFDACERIFRQLKAAGEVIDTNRSLIMDVMSKYPNDVLKEISRRAGVGIHHSTVGELQAALRQFIEESSSLQGILGDLEPFGNRGTSSSHNRQELKPSPKVTFNVETSALSTVDVMAPADAKQSVSVGSSPPKPCYFCGDKHFNDKCDKYYTVDQRVKRLQDLNICCRCMGPTHTASECRTNVQRLRCYFCKTGRHPSPLCPVKFCLPASTSKTSANFTADDRSAADPETAPNEVASDSVAGLCLEEQSLLSTAVATVVNPLTGARERVRVILDSGSHRSYITDKLVDRLALQCKQSEQLEVSVFGTKRSLSVTSHQVQFDVKLRAGGSIQINAHTTPIITTCSLSPGKFPAATQHLIESMEYAMADDFNNNHGPPDVLIGTDYFWELITGARMKTEEGIYVIPSSLGLILGGRYGGENAASNDYPSLLCITERTFRDTAGVGGLCAISTESKAAPVYPDVDEFWSLERLGITDDPIEDDDTIAMEQFNKTVYFDNGRYHVCWPWKANKYELPTNYQLALGRLRSLTKRLAAADISIRQEYSNVINQQLAAGIIEKVPPLELRDSHNLIHYLPHHPIVKLGNNTTKVRVVYDASSKCGSAAVSLNDCLYRGPVILPDLCSVLIRFRLNKVAVVADIEKAFLQISLHPAERDVTRFLMLKDVNKGDVDNNIETLRFNRVLFGAIASPFLLGAVIQHHLCKSDTDTARLINNNTYVDNVITGVAHDGQAVRFYDEAKSLFGDAGMNLRVWCSNSENLMSAIPIGDQTKDRDVKVLGLRWDSRADVMQLQDQWANRLTCRTKREVLQATASIYDPLGLFQPCTLQAKCLLRELWNVKSGWDDIMSDELQQKWKELHGKVAAVFNVAIPRFIGSLFGEGSSLVVFSDASIDAYATAVYLRTPDPSNKWVTNLVFAKSRLAPRQASAADISLPRLELLGLTIAAKATEFVRRALSLPHVPRAFLMCDSSCVLGWLRSDKPLPVFINNRIKVIRSLENVEFHHVGTKDNAADIATRGLLGSEIASSSMWWHGPRWLADVSSTWPTTSVVDVITDQQLRDIQLNSRQRILHSMVAVEAAAVDDNFPLHINPAKYSSLRQLLRVTARCVKYLRLVLWDKLPVGTQEVHEKLRRIFESTSTSGNVTAREIAAAKMMWVAAAQSSGFAEVATAIQHNKRHPLIKQLNVNFDDVGNIRCYGRLDYADLPADSIYPLLLPKNNAITDLIIRESHEKLFHAGISHTLSQIRREFWIPQGRNAVRKIITRCTLCRKMKGPPFAIPRMPPWPRERLSKSKPFQFTGVDYFGPVNVSVNDVTTKMWVCLFTCLSVRAIHLEHVSDCSAQCFINCVSRFISRRGCPEQVISDNAPQFRLAKTLFDKTWHDVLRDASVQSYISDKGVSWRFTTELSPWQGGFYERLVGLVKNAFKSAVGRKLLHWDQFVTLIAEVEAIVNTRPLTYVCSDFKSGWTLRPVDFLAELPTGTPEIDPDTRPEGGDAGKNLTRYWKSKQRRLRLLWRRWYDDYLLSLREKGQHDHRQGKRNLRSTPFVGEVVLVKNDDASRGAWKLGKILKLISSSYGSVRSAELILPNRQIIRRSLCHLYRLEVPPVADEETTVGQGGNAAVGTRRDGEAADAAADVGSDNDDTVADPAGEGHHDVDIVPDAVADVGGIGADDTTDVGYGDDGPFDGFTVDEVDAAEHRVGRPTEANSFAGFAGAVERNILNSLADTAVVLWF